MSQRAALRGFLLGLLPVLATLPAFAQQPGLVITPSTIQVRQGGTSATASARVTFFATGAPSSGEISFSGLPAGVSTVPGTIGFSIPVGQSSTTVSFKLSASSRAVPGTYYEIMASASPFQMNAFITVVVLPALPPGKLSATMAKSSITVCPGGPPVQNTVTVTPLEGYTGTPTVTFPLLPGDVTVTPSSIRVPQLPPARDVSFDVMVAAGTAPGQRVVVVRVSDDQGTYTGTTFTVNIAPSDYGPVVSPPAATLEAGGAGVSVTASLAPDSCLPPPTITVRPGLLPEGVSTTPISAVLAAPDYTPVVFTYSASSSAPEGTAATELRYTPSTGEAKAVPIAVTVVRPGRIGAEVELRAIGVCPGGGAKPNSLTVSSLDGYAGTPTVTFPSLPSGLTVTPSTILVPSVPPSRVVTFTVSASPETEPGLRGVTALVSDPRGVSASASFLVNVQAPDFTPAAVPAAVLLNAGGAASTVTASLVPGDCVPTSDITVTPSGLPPGMTVTPASAIISPPAFSPATFSFRASPSAVPGPSTITFTFAAGGDTTETVTTEVTVCGDPGAPVSPVVRPQGNSAGPVTATDFLALGWGAPASGSPMTRFEWRINAGGWTSTTGTSASAPPRGAIDPVQLFVRGYACDPEKGPGAEAASPVYSLAPPVASFSVPASIVAGQPATFTDTSSPQATSWLWFPGDGVPATTVQSPTVTFTAAGPKTVVLVATNGSGSSTKSTAISVLPASAVRAGSSATVQSLGREPDGRLALARVEVVAGTTLLLRRLGGEGDSVVFLRLVDADGKVVVERRLVLAAGEEARHDLSAWGATGAFRLEVVGPEGLEAAVEQASIPLGEPGLPVTPRRLAVGGN